VAQAVVALPLVILVETFGYTRFQPLNAILAIFGFLSLSVAVFNLLPVPPLDGAVAWALLPALIKRPPARASKRESAVPLIPRIARATAQRIPCDSPQ
jgi:Zn-dependent protease